MNENTVQQSQVKFTQAVDRFKDELKKLRTGRASAGMLDGITVEVYGSSMPLNQVANVTAPEAQLLQITPFDPSSIQAISNAIRDAQSLGLNPSDDGRVVRVSIPALNEERRREITKQVGAKLEECMIAMRSVRHDAINTIDQAKKDKSIGEDEAKRLVGQIDDQITRSKSEAESLGKAKEAEIMKI
jgi:ribosome recycling factor